MNTNTVFSIFGRGILAGFLSVCLILPATPVAALANGKGKKDFKEGIKYEQMQQWDMAAQKFALAVNADPSNPEYKIHYLRALQQVAIMYVKRGDTLAEQKDYASAYTAYRTAYNYDQGNEVAKFKMEKMMELQKAEMQGLEPVNYNIRTGNVKPINNDIQMATKPRSKGDVLQNVSFKDAEFKTVANTLARGLGLNVVFDDQVKQGDKLSIELNDVTMAKALDIVMMQKKYTFEQVDRRTIFIYPDNTTNRPRFEKMLVKTFFMNNISAQQARTVLTAMLPPGRQIMNFDQGGGGSGGQNTSNILLVKATPSELQLVQDILDSIDKNRSEVVLDVEIFEVSHDSLLQIGNQLATDKSVPLTSYAKDKNGDLLLDKDGRPIQLNLGSSATLTNLGGIGLAERIGGKFNPIFPIAGLTAIPSAFGIGALVGLPPTSLSLLQQKGNSKLLYKTQIHVLDGGQNTTKVGKKVPVSLGSGVGGGFGGFGGFGGGIPGQQGVPGAGAGAGFNTGFGNLGGGFGFPGSFNNIQYQDVGLVIKAQPTITHEGYVEIKMEFETSDIIAGADPLNPSFTQRSLNTVARIQDSVTSIVAGVNQEQKGDSRSGIPFLGMLPIVGRLFTTPRQTSSQSDIIITVTPHIIRSAGINSKDYLAHNAGVVQGGINQSIEEVVNRAQAEEDEERRLIAQQNQPGVPLDAPAAAPQTTVPASQSAGAAPPTTIRPVSNQSNGGRVINERSLIAPPVSSNPSVNVPSAPDQPLSDARPQSGDGQTPRGDGQVPQGKDGEQPDLSQYMTQPLQPVAPATVVSASRPEHVERAIARLMAEERARKAAEASNKSAKPQPEPEFPKEYLTPGPNQKVPQAAPKMASGPNVSGTSGVTFRLSPSPIPKQQVGKTFSVTVEVNGQSQMSGANVALKFDGKKLRVKSVKDAGMFGNQPELLSDINDNSLVVRIKNPQNTPVRAGGRLITIEFETLAAGETEIAFNNNDTKARIGSALTAASGNPAQVVISRDSVASETK
ncbi:MAG: cohesin domain-containing protein [Blastocatellia bacterium]